MLRFPLNALSLGSFAPVISLTFRRCFIKLNRKTGSHLHIVIWGCSSHRLSERALRKQGGWGLYSVLPSLLKEAWLTKTLCKRSSTMIMYRISNLLACGIFLPSLGLYLPPTHRRLRADTAGTESP